MIFRCCRSWPDLDLRDTGEGTWKIEDAQVERFEGEDRLIDFGDGEER